MAQADPTTGHHTDVDDKNVIPLPRPKALDDPDAGGDFQVSPMGGGTGWHA